MYNANNFKIIAVDEHGAEISRFDLREIDITHYGEIMAISNPLDPEKMVNSGYGEHDAYKTAKVDKMKYVCISYEDAVNIIDMLNQAINTLDAEPEKGIDDDIRVFGDKAISYERLIDRLDGLCYPIFVYKNKKNKEEEVNKEE